MLFNKNFLDNLDIGVHTLDVNFNGGGTAATTFTISRVTTINKVTKQYFIKR